MSLTSPNTTIEGVETSRFRLRPLTSADEGLYQEIYCDPETMQYVGEPLSMTQATRSFHSAVKQTEGPDSPARFLVIIDKRSGAGIGICSICVGVPRWKSAEIGMMLTSSARSHGFSAEVLGRVADVAFATTDASQVWVRYAKEHNAAERLVRGLGFSIGAEPPPDGDSRLSASALRESWQANNRGTSTCRT